MAFTIECGIVTVGLRFERRFLASPLQIHVAKRFVPAVCPDSRKPPRELLWKTDPKRPLIGLRNHLTESISGILLEQSGEVVRILELTFFFWRSLAFEHWLWRLRTSQEPYTSPRQMQVFQC